MTCLKILKILISLIILQENKNCNGFCNKISISKINMKLSTVIHNLWNSLSQISRDSNQNVLIFMDKEFIPGPIQMIIYLTSLEHPINCFKLPLTNKNLKNKKSCITKQKDKLFKLEVLDLIIIWRMSKSTIFLKKTQKINLSWAMITIKKITNMLITMMTSNWVHHLDHILMKRKMIICWVS